VTKVCGVAAVSAGVTGGDREGSEVESGGDVKVGEAERLEVGDDRQPFPSQH